MITEPRWRSGRSPSTPARCGEHTPLPPTMQPYLHIFSHLAAPTAAHSRKPLLARHSPSPVPPGSSERARLQHARADARAATAACLSAPAPGDRAQRPAQDRTPIASIRSASPRAAARSRSQLIAAALLAGCGSSSPGGTSADPAGAVPASAPLYAGASVRPTGAAEDSGARRRQGAHPSGRPLPAAARGAADARLAAAELQPRRRTLARPARRRLPHLAAPSSSTLPSQLEQGLLGSAQLAAAFPFGRERRAGRDRAGHERQRQGALVPERAGREGRRARDQLPRRRLRGQRAAASPSGWSTASR